MVLTVRERTREEVVVGSDRQSLERGRGGARSLRRVAWNGTEVL